MAYNVSDEYKQVIYSGETKNNLWMEYGSDVIEDTSPYVSSLKIERRLLNNGENYFSLNNFVSQMATMEIHDYDMSKDDEIFLKLGTEVNNEYEYVPLGYFKIKDRTETTNGKTELKLIDRTYKFDVYLDTSELYEDEKTATKLNLVQWYCEKVGVELATPDFVGKDDITGVYDNTISARVHIAYIAESCGCMATIGRDGKLYFIPIKKSTRADFLKTTIPEQVFSNELKFGDKYKISRVTYEGPIKLTAGNDTADTLFIDSSNPYITKQQEIDRIYNQIKDFEIYSLNSGSIIGDPTIECFDFVRWLPTNDDGTSAGVYITLGQNNFEFNGVMKQTFETTIDKQEKSVNMTIASDETKYQRIKQTIDNVNGELTIEISKKVGNDEVISRINASPEQVSIKANKISLEGVITANEGFMIDKKGNATMNNAKIKGGKLELYDEGSTDTQEIVIYNKNGTEQVQRPVVVGDELDDEVMLFTFPYPFDGPSTPPSLSHVVLVQFENGALTYSYGYQYSTTYTIAFEQENVYQVLYEDWYDDLAEQHHVNVHYDSIMLPFGVGKVTYVDKSYKIGTEPITDYFQIIDEFVKNKTLLRSKGLQINDENINTYYQGDGFQISAPDITSYFRSFGMLWQNGYGPNFTEFTFNKNNQLLYANYAGSSYFMIDAQNRNNQSLEYVIEGNSVLKCEKDKLTTRGRRVVEGDNLGVLRMLNEDNPYLEMSQVINFPATAYGVHVWSSDKRLKHDIKDTEIKGLDIVKKLKHKQFIYNSSKNEHIIKIGYIADELQEIDEDLIFEVGEDKIKQPRESYIIPILSKAIQEQQEMIDDLKKKIQDLEKNLIK